MKLKDAPWKKSYDQPRQHIKKQRHYFANKGPLVKAMVSTVVMYGCESWTIKKAERWRVDAFELWCWRLLRVPWTARRSNQSTLKEISPEYSLEGLMLKRNSSTLATWCEELTHLKRPWCWARLKAGGEGDDRGWDGWMVSLTQWTWVWASSGSWWWTGRTGMLQSMGSQKVRLDWVNWTELNWTELKWTVVQLPLSGNAQGVPLQCLDVSVNRPLERSLWKNWKTFQYLLLVKI